MEHFSQKTYEKTCRFYNIFSKSRSNYARSETFTICIFFSKILWRFQFNVHVFHFPPLLRENLWKDLLILWLIFELFMVICRFTKFFGLKLPSKKMARLSKCHQFLINFRNFEQRLRKKLWKDLPFFFNIFKLPLFLYVFIKFHDQQITKKSMPFVSICQQKLVYCPNFEQYSWQKLWKTLQFV